MSEEATKLAESFGGALIQHLTHPDSGDVTKAIVTRRRDALLAYIERIERERDEARDLNNRHREEMEHFRERAHAAEAENARLRPNAERYEWLRDWRIRRDGEQFEVRRFEQGLLGRPGKWYYPSGEHLDAAIDAARKT